MRAAVHQLMMCSNTPSSVKQELIAPGCAVYFHAYCCLSFTSPGQQYYSHNSWKARYSRNTGGLLFAVCQCRASPSTAAWCIFDACVRLYLQERKLFKLYVLSAASQAFRLHLMCQGLRK